MDGENEDADVMGEGAEAGVVLLATSLCSIFFVFI